MLNVRYGDVEEIALGAAKEAGEAVEKPSASILQEFPPLISLFPRLFVAFWTLKLGDLQHPKESYEEAIRMLNKRASDVEMGTSAAFEDWDAAKKTKEVARLRAQISVLEQESASQKARVDRVKSHFKSMASIWLKDVPEDDRNDIAAAFLQDCLFPRCLMSVEDSTFCAEFLFLLQESKTQFFCTLRLLQILAKFTGFALRCKKKKRSGFSFD